MSPKNKVIALVGLGAQAMAVQTVKMHAVVDVNVCCLNLNFVDAKAAVEGIKSISIPDDTMVVTCDTANIFLPAPWLKNPTSRKTPTAHSKLSSLPTKPVAILSKTIVGRTKTSRTRSGCTTMLLSAGLVKYSTKNQGIENTVDTKQQ